MSGEGLTPVTIDFTALADALTVPDGGFTITSYGMSVTTGYAVSVRKDLEWRGRGPISVRRIHAYARDNWSVLCEPGSVLGGWHDPDTGNVYLDVSRVVDTARAAYVLACQHGQLSFYDLARGVSVPVTDLRFTVAA